MAGAVAPSPLRLTPQLMLSWLARGDVAMALGVMGIVLLLVFEVLLLVFLLLLSPCPSLASAAAAEEQERGRSCCCRSPLRLLVLPCC